MATTTEKPWFSSLLESDRRYKYLDSFITLFVLVLVVSNIIAPKFFAIGTLRISAAQILFPITYIFGDIFTEVYGYSASRRAIWYGFFGLFIFTLLSYAAVVIPPAPEYTDQRLSILSSIKWAGLFWPVCWPTGAANSRIRSPWRV